jgi:hypothetical protein
MSNEPTDLTGFERKLAEALPHPGGLQRDALLFAAGRAAGRRGTFWPTAAGMLALVSLGLGGIVAFRPPAVIEVVRVEYRSAPLADRAPAPAESAQIRSPLASAAPLAPEWVEGLRLRERVIRDGVTSLPSPAWAPAPEQPTTDEVPEMSALRLNINPAPGDSNP